VYYTYVMMSETDGRFYTGATGDLRRRVALHAGGRVRSTAARRPLRLLYYEACLSPDDAYRRERFLKTGKGGRYLRNRLASSLAEIGRNKLERH
jgi:putative endonuclease